MHFASDNAGPAHPSVFEALARADDDKRAAPYGNDPLSLSVADRLRALFEAPRAAVFLLPTGTAANSLALATLCPPYRSVICAPLAHIECDEGAAPEFYTGGAKLRLAGDGAVMTPEALEAALTEAAAGGIHGPKPGAVSVTNVAETGDVVPLDRLRALSDVARAHGVPVHLDGARFANACVALDCTPAELSWRAGVDVAVFGGTKNGLLGVEAVLFFDPDLAESFAERRKRGGHLFSKHRYLAAQMDAYLTDDLWRGLAARANAACDRLHAGLLDLGVEIVNDTWANMVFIRLPRAQHRALRAAGAVYSLSGDPHTGPDDTSLTARLVCDWSMGANRIDEFLSILGSVRA